MEESEVVNVCIQKSNLFCRKHAFQQKLAILQMFNCISEKLANSVQALPHGRVGLGLVRSWVHGGKMGSHTLWRGDFCTESWQDTPARKLGTLGFPSWLGKHNPCGCEISGQFWKDWWAKPSSLMWEAIKELPYIWWRKPKEHQNVLVQ